MDKAEHKRIQSTDKWLMLSVAVLADLVSIIPVVGNIIALVFGGGTLALWLLIKGIPLVSPKKLATWGTGGLIESIPALSALPGYTVGLLIMIAIVEVEDRTGISIPAPGKKLLAGGRSQRAKTQRRIAMSSERRSEMLRRAHEIERIRRSREATPEVRGRAPFRNITPLPQNV